MRELLLSISWPVALTEHLHESGLILVLKTHKMLQNYQNVANLAYWLHFFPVQRVHEAVDTGAPP